MYAPMTVELIAIVIGLLLVGIVLFLNRKPRNDGSRYYKLTPNRKDLMEIPETGVRVTKVGAKDRVKYFTARPLALFLLIKLNEQTLNQIAGHIGWFSTTILGFACLYIGWFCIVSFPGVGYHWMTDQSPRYTPVPWEKNPPPES